MAVMFLESEVVDEQEMFSPSFIHQVDIKCPPCARHYAGVIGLLGSRDVGGYLSSFLHSLGPEG